MKAFFSLFVANGLSITRDTIHVTYGTYRTQQEPIYKSFAIFQGRICGAPTTKPNILPKMKGANWEILGIFYIPRRGKKTAKSVFSACQTHKELP